MKEEPLHPWIEPELEARIVALVLGEASDFEREELERLIEEKAELAMFKKRMQAVHGLLREVATGESLEEAKDWKLSDEKRQALLAVIDEEKGEKKKPQTPIALKTASTENPKLRPHKKDSTKKSKASALSIAIVVHLGLAAILMLYVVYTPMGNPPAFSVASRSYSDDVDEIASEKVMKMQKTKRSPISPAHRYTVNQAEIASRSLSSVGSRPPTADASSVAKSNSRKESRSSLSSIRGNLARYSPTAEEPALIESKLKNIILPKVEFQDTPLKEALATLQEQSAEFDVQAIDPATKGVNFNLSESVKGAEDEGITLNLSNVPLVTALKYTSSLANLRYKVEPGGVDIVPLSSPDNDLVTTTYKVSPSFMAAAAENNADMNAAADPFAETEEEASTLEQKRTAKNILVEAGVTFAPGASVIYNPETSELIVRNTQDQLELVEAYKDSIKEKSNQLSFPDTNGNPSPKSSNFANGFQLATTADSSDPFADDASSNELSGAKTDRKNSPLGHGQTTPIPILGESLAMPQSAPLYASSGGSGTMTGVTSGSYANTTRNQTRADFLQQVEMEWELPVPSRIRAGVEIDSDKPAESNAGALLATRSPTVKSKINLQKRKTKTKPALNSAPKTAEKKLVRNKQTMDKIYRRTPEVVGGGRHSGKLAEIEKIEIAAGGPITLKTKKAKGNLRVKSSASTSIQIKKSPAPTNLNEKSAATEAFSTFSLHVSDVSFKLAQDALAKGEWPEASKVRIEEFVNAFDYDDAMPNADEKVACRLEQAIHPFLQQRNLLRVSMRTAAAGRSSQTPLRLTFLLDNSGSMERSDRQQTVRRAFALLTAQLKPMDQVTLISFARQPRLLADQVSGAKANQLVQLIANLPSEGGTNLEAALQLAFEKAQEQQLDRAQNRIIMLTDGAANLGNADPERLSKMIENMRTAGIAFDAAGIGADGLNDEILEALTRKGDGRYYLLDRPESADQGFARQIAGALRPAAKNVKVQIEFNPKRVGKYKLLGFEKHRLNKEDFRNDQVDAAEMAAAEAGVAVYQFEAKPDGEGDVGSVSVRFLDMNTGLMVENRWPIPYQADAPRLDQAAPSLRIASAAALLAAKLKGGADGSKVDLQTLSNLIANLPARQRQNKRIQQLQQMLNVARASNP